MTFTIELTPTEEARLRDAAKQEGLAPEEFLNRLVTDHLPQRAGMTFDQITAPLRQDFQESGMTEAEFDALVEEAREEVWQERHKGSQVL